MILSTNVILDQLKSYANPYGKMGRLVKEEKLIPLRKGLYENNANVSGIYLANAIYGPSYISFNYALAYYGLIPEAVYEFTSATTEKKKKKSFNNRFGTFSYRDVPVDVYQYGINIIEEGGYSFMIASKEKALCDKLYELPPVKNLKELEELLFNDMRIDETEFDSLNREDIYFIAPKYRVNNLKHLEKYLRRRHHEQHNR